MGFHELVLRSSFESFIVYSFREIIRNKRFDDTGLLVREDTRIKRVFAERNEGEKGGMDFKAEGV